jgi:nicotinate dehydrogenase subunit A
MGSDMTEPTFVRPNPRITNCHGDNRHRHPHTSGVYYLLFQACPPEASIFREEHMATKVLSVNGERVRIRIDDPDMPLLYALRDNLALKGPRFGCGLAQCGACTVHVDGKAVRSCVTPLSSLKSKQKVVTLEGLGTPQRPHPVQAAFIAEQAVQCGYCINGMIMESAAFLASKKNPTEAQIKEALANNLCRCGTHARIVRAVKRAAGTA